MHVSTGQWHCACTWAMTGLAYPRANVVQSKWSVALLHFSLLVLAMLSKPFSQQLCVTPSLASYSTTCSKWSNNGEGRRTDARQILGSGESEGRRKYHPSGGWTRGGVVNQSYKEEITQLRRHKTLLAGQVRLLQEHIQGSSPCPPQATYVFCEMKEGNLIGVDTNEAGALK